MSLRSFSTSERNDAEIPVPSATSASESCRALRTWRSCAPTGTGAVLSVEFRLIARRVCGLCLHEHKLWPVQNSGFAVGTEAVVIGAGVTGLSIAFHLAEAGVEPLIVERSGVAAEASGVQP